MLILTIKLPGADALQIPRNVRAGALKASSNEVLSQVREHMRGNGGRKYWREAAKSAILKINAEEATITIAHAGAALHYFGGVVLPGAGVSSKTGKATKLLAIPRGTDEAPIMYGSPLAFVPIKGKPSLRGLLLPGQEKKATRPHKGKPAGRVITVALPGAKPVYYLVNRTVHLPNPNILPTPDEMASTAQQATNDYLDIAL